MNLEEVVNEVILDMEFERDQIDRASNYHRKLEFIRLGEFIEKLLKGLNNN